MASKKGFSPRISTYYKIDGDKLTRTKKTCPRCGKGLFMSDHKDRHTCGSCGFTEFK